MLDLVIKLVAQWVDKQGEIKGSDFQNRHKKPFLFIDDDYGDKLLVEEKQATFPKITSEIPGMELKHHNAIITIANEEPDLGDDLMRATAEAANNANFGIYTTIITDDE